MVESPRICKHDLTVALAAEEQNNHILDLLFKHIHKQSIEVCLELMLKIDFEQAVAVTPRSFKCTLFTKATAVIESYSPTDSPPALEEQV